MEFTDRGAHRAGEKNICSSRPCPHRTCEGRRDYEAANRFFVRARHGMVVRNSQPPADFRLDGLSRFFIGIFCFT
jgi:hypothetical protein